MKVFCADGTTIECAAFRAVDAGILVFDEEPEDDEPHQEATGFVPLAQLKYVLPEGAQPGPQQMSGARQAGPVSAGPGGGGQFGGGAGQFGGGGGQLGGGGQPGGGTQGPSGPGGRRGGSGTSPGEQPGTEPRR